MDHRVESELMVTSERFAFGQRTRVAQDEKSALKELPGHQPDGRVRGPTNGDVALATLQVEHAVGTNDFQ